jgi:phage head maturation protease
MTDWFDLLDASTAPDASLELRSAEQREIAMRIVPWDVPAITRAGPEVIVRGAFGEVDPSKVVLQLEHENPPAGKGITYEDRADGAWMTFKVSKTQRGDDILTLAGDGVATGASITFQDAPDGVELYRAAGRTMRIVRNAALRAVSTTWRPTWAEAAVQSIRSQGDTTVSETTAQPEAPAIDFGPLIAAIEAQGATQTAALAPLANKVADLEERARKDIIFPEEKPEENVRSQIGPWMEVSLKLLSGERVAQDQLRAWTDIVTTDNLGVVPSAYIDTLIGITPNRRPFLNSTRRLSLPPVGMHLIVPKIVTPPTTGTQSTEKSLITSTATSITTATYDSVTIAGGGDLSLQLVKRSGPSFLELYLAELLASLSKNAEIAALTAVFVGDSSGGTLDPANASFGAAWRNAAAVNQQADTIWLSSEGVAAFIDAKATTTNTPLYSNLAGNFTAGGGPGGTISGLRPVWVPALDTVAGDIDAIIGPSSGFAWTEDGTYTLQVDVPSKAGRDVAVVSMFWFAPLYPTAFTSYTITGS